MSRISPSLFPLQLCPDGETGRAYWQCGTNSDWVGYPDLSGCTRIDVTPALNELDNDDSVPSEVIRDLYRNVTSEDTIASGDIEGILGVIEKAILVQIERLPNQTQPESYADAFTSESINLLDDLLRRPVPWLGIAQQEKMMKLGEIQTRIDEISHTLVTYSESAEHEYTSAYNSERVTSFRRIGVVRNAFRVFSVVKLKVFRDVNTNDGLAFSSGESSIHVTTSGQPSRSITFQAFESFGCILDRRESW
jgi:hypothetical protein